MRTIFSSPSVHDDRDGTPASFLGLKGSALVRNHDLMLTVVNPHVSDTRETEIVVRGAAAESGDITMGYITTLTHSDFRAHNTFQQRQVVVPQSRISGRECDTIPRSKALSRSANQQGAPHV